MKNFNTPFHRHISTDKIMADNPDRLLRLARILQSEGASARLDQWMRVEEAVQAQLRDLKNGYALTATQDATKSEPTAAWLLIGLDREKFIQAVVEEAPQAIKEKLFLNKRRSETTIQWRRWIDQAMSRFATTKQDLAALSGKEKITLEDILDLDTYSQRTNGRFTKGIISTRLHNRIYNDHDESSSISTDILQLRPKQIHKFVENSRWAGESTLAEILALKMLIKQTDRFKMLAAPETLGLKRVSAANGHYRPGNEL